MFIFQTINRELHAKNQLLEKNSVLIMELGKLKKDSVKMNEKMQVLKDLNRKLDQKNQTLQQEGNNDFEQERTKLK